MRFELTHGGNATIAQWEDALCPQVLQTFEGERYGLIIHGANPDDALVLKVGDIYIGAQLLPYPDGYAFTLGNYFESSYGPTQFSVVRRGEDGAEVTLTKCTCYVVPTKIGNDNYCQMVADLQSLCRALINDLLGKSRYNQEWDETLQPHLARSLAEELAAIRRTWRDLKPLLEGISHAPSTDMQHRLTMAKAGRTRSRRGVAAMMKKGGDPRFSSPARKYPTYRLQESADIPEHRLIRGFLQFLAGRLGQCRKGIRNDMENIEADREFRNRPSHPGEPSLYESQDVPRLNKLRQHSNTVGRLEDEIREMVLSDFWRGIPPITEYPEPGTIPENACYVRIANIILRYLKNGFNKGGVIGQEFTLKETSRIYEQWVLIQLVAAFEYCGLEMETWESVVRQSLGSQFRVDFPKNTRFFARLEGHYAVLIRYEPWIAPHARIANHPEETLCHFKSQDMFWRPDFVVELVDVQDAQHPKTVYAVVLDAKYSRVPSAEMVSSVEKYQAIRSTDGARGRQVARQVWLVYLGRGGSPQGLSIDALGFSSSLGPIYADGSQVVLDSAEYFKGEMILRPDAESLLPDTDGKKHGIHLHKPMLDFASGTLAYFRHLIEEQ